MLRPSCLLILLCVVLAACQSPQAPAPVPDLLHGLASPVRLQLDTTVVLLTDYFTDKEEIDSVRYGGKGLAMDSLGRVRITGPVPAPVTNLEVYAGGGRYDIPVFASEKVRHTFVYTASSSAVQTVGIAGSMNGWNHKAGPLKKEGQMWSIELVLDPGVYQYRIWEDGKEGMDAGNPETMDNGMGGLNNVMRIGSTPEEKPMLYTTAAENGQFTISHSPSVKEVLVYLDNTLLNHSHAGSTIIFSLPESAAEADRAHLRIFGHDGGRRTNDLLIPLHHGRAITETKELTRSDWQASVMYFMMVDRFMNGDTTNDRPTPDPTIHPKANNLGGDLQGITQKIRDGYFRELGITTLWISPISQNAEGAWGLWNKGVTSTFSAYHGYWPTSLTRIDDRLGSEAALRELIEVAHQNGMNVILDYVAHHVHQDHPLYKQKPEWTTPLYLPDGTMNTEKWDEHRLTTWFDTFLPTWDFSRPEVVDALTDTALFWVKEYDLDGFRHDATKHIPEEFWRELTRKTKRELAATPGRRIFQIGETYGNAELINSYIGSGQMDAQFDFNLYDAAVDAFAKPQTDFANLQRVLDQSLYTYGSHHLMGNITGNQDRARFASYADGSVKFEEDPKLAGWTRDIRNAGPEGFARMEMLNAFLMTAPGIPCIYYGDEIGMPGGNDPDNRRMMVFEGWNEEQKDLHKAIRSLANLRRTRVELNYGEFIPLYQGTEGIVYARHYFGRVTIVAFSKVPGSVITFPLPEFLRDKDYHVFGRSEVHRGLQTLSVPVGEEGYVVLLDR